MFRASPYLRKECSDLISCTKYNLVCDDDMMLGGDLICTRV